MSLILVIILPLLPQSQHSQSTLTIIIFLFYSIFMNMTKTVVVRQGKETSDYWRIYPPFLWLLRDVLLEVPKIDGKEVTATEYLKREVLLEGSDMGSDICKALVNFFPSFECKILSPPSLSEDTMKHVAENMHQLNPSFNEGVERLLTFLENNVKPKKIFDAAGRGCDGRTLAELVKVIAKEVDAGATLALDNTWKLVVESRCQAVQKNLLAKYITTVQDCYEKASGGLPIEQIADADTITVMGIHTQVWGNIQTMLSSELGSLLSAHVTEDYTLHTVVKQLEDQIIVHDQSQVVIGGALFSVIEENRRRSSKYCTNLFHESYTPLKKKVAAGKDGYSTADLEADIETLFQDYDKTAIGPEKLQVRSEMKKSIEENQEIFAKHLEELIKRTQEETEARKIQESLRNELQSLNESRRQLDAKFSEFTDQQRKAEKKRTEETEEEVRKLKERVEMHEIKEKEMHEKEIHLVGEEAKRKAEAEYMRKMSEAKINDLKTTLERNRKEAEAQKATFNQEIEDMQKSLKEKENENDKFKDEKQREIEEMEETLRKMREKETARIAEADEQLDKIKQDLEKKQGQAKKQQARLEKELHDTEHKLEQQKLESEQMDKDFLKTIRDLEEENEKERKMKVLASEEAQNTRERLDQVVETGKEREAQIKISWQQKLAEKEKTKDDLSGKIDKLTKAIHAFENKPLVKLFGYKIVRK